MAENLISASEQNNPDLARRTLLDGSGSGGGIWMDFANPEAADMEYLANRYQLHPLTLQDCLQPDHLPKFENTAPGCAFLIIRVYDASCKYDPESLQDLSNKIAVFIGPDYLITLHRTPYPFLEEVAQQLGEWSRTTGKAWTCAQALGRILREAGETYFLPARKIETEIDYFESRIFLRARTPDLLRSLYKIKRKASLFRRLILLSREPIQQSRQTFGARHSQLYHDVSDRQLELETLYEGLTDNIHQLMNLYISLSSQRTNEVMRVLTIFSVFFLPLTFIVGVYGMNFPWMPEFTWEWGYAFVWGIMALVTLIVFIWFRTRKWL